MDAIAAQHAEPEPPDWLLEAAIAPQDTSWVQRCPTSCSFSLCDIHLYCMSQIFRLVHLSRHILMGMHDRLISGHFKLPRVRLESLTLATFLRLLPLIPSPLRHLLAQVTMAWAKMPGFLPFMPILSYLSLILSQHLATQNGLLRALKMGGNLRLRVKFGCAQ